MTASGHRVRLRAERGANRAAIIAAADSALRERPFRELSIDELMQDAGLARTQFYRHFDDLSDLVLKVTGRAFENLLTDYAKLVEVAEITEENMREGFTGAVDAFVEHGPLVRAAFEAAVYDAAVEEVVTAVQDRFVALTARLVRRAHDEGLAAGTTDPRETARVLHHANVTYLVETFGREPRVSPDVARDTLTAIWFAVLGR